MNEKSFPKRCVEDLIIQSLDDETLIYDNQTNQGHCLNGLSNAIWECCDGESSLKDISEKVTCMTGSELNDETLRNALASLSEVELIENYSQFQIKYKSRRRSVTKKLASASVLPLIITLNIPSAFAQASCKAKFEFCVADEECCSGNCNTVQNKCVG